jgi:adenylate kinase family enzyme
MKKVAVFGNAGGGKSRLARRLAELTGLPLHVVDMMQFRAGGASVPHDDFLRAHADLLRRDAWIIDGFGTEATVFERIAAADTLIHVDLPLELHVWWVTKRLFKGLFADPPGWPLGSPLWRSSLESYRVLWPCHRHLTPRYRRHLIEAAATKAVHRLRSPAEIRAFLERVAERPQPCRVP